MVLLGRVMVLAAATLGVGCGGGPAAPADGGPDAGQGLVVGVRAVSGDAPAVLPLTVGGLTIETAAAWIDRIEVASDWGGSDQPRIEGVGFDAGHDLEVTVPAAPPGLYSVVHIDLAQAGSAAALPAGFAGQRLSARITGHLASGRAFSVNDQQGSSFDVRAAQPMQLAAGKSLHVILETDVGTWLQNLSLDSGSDSEPLVIGPDGDGGDLDTFRNNLDESFRVVLDLR